jgi:hypothetical protein
MFLKCSKLQSNDRNPSSIISHRTPSRDERGPCLSRGIASLNPMDLVLVVHGTRRVSRLAVDSSLSEDHLRAIDSFLAPA